MAEHISKSLKIESSFFDLIEKGAKRYEFRKLEKGITSGIYKAVSTWSDDFYYGYLKLTPIAINPTLVSSAKPGSEDYSERINCAILIVNEDEVLKEIPIDAESYKFVLKNYWEKQIDFVVYAVSIVEQIEKPEGGKRDD